MGKAEKYDELATRVIEFIGGKDNISFLTHCVTRLRLNIKDESIVNVEAIKNINRVIGCQWQNGQLQIIIGQGVGEAYGLICKKNGLKMEAAVDNEVTEGLEKKEHGVKGAINAIFDVLSGTFVMFIPVLIAAGMISAVLSLLTTFKVVSADAPTYVVFSAIQSAIFYFLPVFAGYAAGTKLKMNPFIGMALGTILCYSTINGAEGLSLFGIGIKTVTYSSSVFPIILGVLFMSYVEKGMKKIIPDVLKTIAVPAITLLAGVIATLLVLGPIGSWAGEYLSIFITMVSENAGWVAPAIIALIYPLMVFTGMHYSLIPLVMTSLATSGFDPLLMVAGMIGNISEAGAAAGTALIEKDKNKKAEASAIAISALCGVTEPALFGITLRNKKTLISVCLGGFAGALFAGIMSCKAYGFVGGLPSLPFFLDPQGGFGNLIVIIISVMISFTVTCLLTFVLNKRGGKNE